MSEQLHDIAPISKTPDWFEVEAHLKAAEQGAIEPAVASKLERLRNHISIDVIANTFPDGYVAKEVTHRVAIADKNGAKSVFVKPDLAWRLLAFDKDSVAQNVPKPELVNTSANSSTPKKSTAAKPLNDAAKPAQVAETVQQAEAPAGKPKAKYPQVFAAPTPGSMLIKGKKSEETGRVYFFRDGGGFMKNEEVAEIGGKVNAAPEKPAPTALPSPVPKAPESSVVDTAVSAAHQLESRRLISDWAKAEYSKDSAASQKAQDAVQEYIIKAQRLGVISEDQVSGFIDELNTRKNDEIEQRAKLFQAQADMLAARVQQLSSAAVAAQPEKPAIVPESLRLTPEQEATLREMVEKRAAGNTPELKSDEDLHLTPQQLANLEAIVAEKSGNEPDKLSIKDRIRSKIGRGALATTVGLALVGGGLKFGKEVKSSNRSRKVLGLAAAAIAIGGGAYLATRLGFHPNRIDTEVADSAMPRSGGSRSSGFSQFAQNLQDSSHAPNPPIPSESVDLSQSSNLTPRPMTLGVFTENVPETTVPPSVTVPMPEAIATQTPVTVPVTPNSVIQVPMPEAVIATTPVPSPNTTNSVITIPMPEAVYAQTPVNTPDQVIQIPMPEAVYSTAPVPSSNATDTMVRIPMPEAVYTRTPAPEVDFSSYNFPSNWASMDRLRELAERARIDGHIVEWHNQNDTNQLNDWIEIDGYSDTPSVLRILSQYA